MGALMLTVDQVAALCNLGVSTVWKLAKDERSGFPKPIYFGTRTTRWKAKDTLTTRQFSSIGSVIIPAIL